MQDLLKRSQASNEKDGNLKGAAEVPAWGWMKEEEEGKKEEGQAQQAETFKEEESGG